MMSVISDTVNTITFCLVDCNHVLTSLPASIVGLYHIFFAPWSDLTFLKVEVRLYHVFFKTFSIHGMKFQLMVQAHRV